MNKQELKNQLARALADYDNLRKRTEAERGVWVKFATQGILVKLLTVLDTLQSAQKHLNDQGLAIVISEFKKIFEEEGLEEIDSKSIFDEKVHEAVDKVTGGEKGKIAEVVMSGWKFKDGPVVRPAKVKVYQDRLPTNKEKKKDNEKELRIDTIA